MMGTVKLSIPKMLICSRPVANIAIKIILSFIAKSPNKLAKSNIQKLVKSIVTVPNKDFF